MKILITENQLIRLVENILIEQDTNRELELLKKKGPVMDWFYENVIDKVKQKYNVPPTKPDFIFYVDKGTGQKYMEYNKENGYLWVNYKIWSYFESHYSSNDKEIRQLIKNMMEEFYGLKVVTSKSWLMIR